jgi:hypothetical protein
MKKVARRGRGPRHEGGSEDMKGPPAYLGGARTGRKILDEHLRRFTSGRPNLPPIAQRRVGAAICYGVRSSTSAGSSISDLDQAPTVVPMW